MLKKLWYGLINYYRSKVVSEHSFQNESISESQQENAELLQSKTSDIQDKDIEFLFNQLLEGVVNGWQDHRIEQFFRKLEHRITVDEWLKWLERFEQKITSSASPNYQIAARMIILGEVTTSLPSINPIGSAAYSIGEKLLNKSSDDLLMKSLRSHLVSKLPKNQENQENPEDSSSSSEEPSSVLLLLQKLQKDSAFAEETARSLGLTTSEPSLIIEKLLEQNNNQNSESKTITSVFSESEIPVKVEPETISSESEIPVKVEPETISSESEIPVKVEPETISSESEIPVKVEPETISEPEIPYPSDWLENWFNTGLQKAQSGDLEGAIASWDQLLKHDPNVAQAWHNRGSALAYLNRLEEAITSFDKAISINVNDYQSWNDRGNVLYNLKRWEEALISWDRTVGIEPNYSQAWYNRGLALEKLNLTNEALESYEEALAIEPNYELARNRKNQLLGVQ